MFISGEYLTGFGFIKKEVREMVKTIITKTIVFIVVMLFVTIFKTIFGDNNMMVGVTTLVLILSTLGRNLTVNPGKNLVLLLMINLTLGLGAFIVGQNIWLGVIINFVILFLIAYFFSYELRKPLNMLVGLHYMLMMVNPITMEELPMRIIALIIGPFLLIGVQLVVNKNKLRKSTPVLLQKIETNLVTKINLLKDDIETTAINQVIIDDINAVKVIVHDSTPKDTHISLLGRSVISVLSCLERINLLLDLPCDGDLLTEVESSIKEKQSLDAQKVELSQSTHTIRDKEFATALEILHQKQTILANLVANPSDLQEKNEPISDEFKENKILKRNLNYNSIRFGYGVRLGMLVAMTSLITSYFNIEYGSWLVYTVFALTQPFVEFTMSKSKKRIIGTIIAAIVIYVFFSVVQGSTLRLGFLLVGGYLLSYAIDYRDVVIFMTIASVASAAMGTVNPGFIIFNRLFFVIIGIIIAVIVNKLFLKSTYADEEKGISNLKVNILDYMFKEIYMNEHGEGKTMDHLYLIPPFIETRIEHWDLNISEERLYRQRCLMNDLHQVHLHLELNPSIQNVMNEIKPLIQIESQELLIEKLNTMMHEAKDLNQWQVCLYSSTLVQQIANV